MWIWIIMLNTPKPKFFSFSLIIELFYALKTCLGLAEILAFFNFYSKNQLKNNDTNKLISPGIPINGGGGSLILGGHPFLFYENFSKIILGDSKLYKKY